MAARFPLAARRVVDWTMPVMAAIVIGLAVGFSAWPRWVAHRAQEALQPPVSASAPNVLLIVLDTVRAKSMSLYGYSRDTTPRLTAFAGRGVVFDRALSTSPWTLPSHGTMFTGRYPAELTADFLSAIDDTHPTLAEEFAGAGYLTAGFVANTSFGGAEFGLGRGVLHYDDHPTSLRSAVMQTSFGSVLVTATGLPRRLSPEAKFSRKSAAAINRSFLRWLSTRQSGRPFFAFLNYFDAHEPYRAPAAFMEKFGLSRPEGNIWSRSLLDWSPDQVRELNTAYDGTLAYLDDQVGRLLDELERLGDLDRTIVVITSDHGEQFGEHDLLEHANSLYLPLLHVPLAMIYPSKLPAGVRVVTDVSLRDLPATILDVAGLGPQSRLPGRSLAALWRGETAASLSPVLSEAHRITTRYPESYPARKGRMRSIVVDGMHYILNLGDGREELYHLARDPDELQDLGAKDTERLSAYKDSIQEALRRARQQ
jgi:arylsulfatase A-like enzyme